MHGSLEPVFISKILQWCYGKTSKLLFFLKKCTILIATKIRSGILLHLPLIAQYGGEFAGLYCLISTYLTRISSYQRSFCSLSLCQQLKQCSDKQFLLFQLFIITGTISSCGELLLRLTIKPNIRLFSLCTKIRLTPKIHKWI